MMTRMQECLRELCVLKLLDDESLDEVELGRHMNTLPGLAATKKDIALLLERLCHDGLVNSIPKELPTGPGKHAYVLTLQGRQQLSNMSDAWQEVERGVTRVIAKDRTFG